MIEITNLRIHDEKARTICEKHIQTNIVSGLSFYIDTYDGNDDFGNGLSVREWFQTDECFSDVFPKGFSGDRLAEMTRIRDLVLSDNVVELTASDKYILMHSLRDFYDGYKGEYSLEAAAAILVRSGDCERLPMKSDEDEDEALSIVPIKNIEDRFYVLLMAARAAHSLADECLLGEEDQSDEEASDEAFMDLCKMFMRDVEDMSEYAEVCFEDLDFELLGDFTREELLGNPAAEMMGLDV